MNCINLNLSFEDILQLLIDGQYQLDSLFHALKIEREGMNRKNVIIAIRRTINNKKGLSLRSINSSIKASETRRRKRIVKNIYSKTSIWALDEIRKIYPDYTEEMFYKDLQPVKKRKRTKEREGYRYVQMKKLATALKDAKYEGNLVNKYAHLFSRHLHNINKPIVCDVVRDDKTYIFDFPANTPEHKVKKFILAVNNGDNLDTLEQHYKAIFNNNYTYM